MSEFDEGNANVLRARQLLQDATLERYRETRSATELEKRLLSEAGELRDYLVEQDDRTFCILAVSFMEEALKQRFKEQWDIQTKDTEKSFFGGNGPLASFSQRLLVAQGLGWLTKDHLKEASLLRHIRNGFAHNHKLHRIDEDPLIGYATSIRPYEESWAKGGMKEYARGFEAASKSTRLRMRVYCSSIFIVSKALKNSKLLASGLPLGIKDGDGYYSLTEIEQTFIDYVIQHCFKTVGVVLSEAQLAAFSTR